MMFRILPRVFLLVSAILHFAFGGVVFFQTEAWMAAMELQALAGAGLTELRALAGVALGLGGVFLFAALVPQAIGLGLLVMGMTYGGAVLARSIGIFWFGDSNAALLTILAIELVGLGSSLAGWWMIRRSPPV